MSTLMYYPDGETSTATPTAPDIYYVRSRSDLLQFEDARFNSLIQAVPNYYVVENDQSLWGDFLRAIARELSFFEYDYAYDLVNKNPIFLTPPDIRRRWAAPLYINRLYPTLDPVQYDLAYKSMLSQLIQAYRLGSTVQSLEDIIFAYTGLDVQVIQLYTLIGQGFYDQSDRNSIAVSIQVGGPNALDSVVQLNQLEAITTALYSAIDYGKPAAVGLELATVFSTGEDLSHHVVDVSINTQGIMDTLRIYVELIEPEPYDPMLWQAPDHDPLTPKTGLAPVQGWPASNIYNPSLTLVLNNSIIDENQYVQLVTTGGTTFAAWSSTDVAQVTQTALTGNVATYTAVNDFSSGQHVTVINTMNGGGVFNVTNALITFANSTSFQITLVHANVSVAPEVVGEATNLTIQKSYTLNFEVVDAHGFIQKVTTAGVTGFGYPNFNEQPGGTTAEVNNIGAPTGLVWTNQGTFTFNPILSSTVNPALYSITAVSSPVLGIATYTGNFNPVPAVGSTVLIAGLSHSVNNGLLQVANGSTSTQLAVVNSAAIAEITSATARPVTVSGTVVFQNQGRIPGLLAPRINEAWEVPGGDTLTTFEAS